MRILVVEDNYIARIAYQSFLKIDGFSVEFAEDGLEAIRKASAKYDAILMDINLPYLNGIEVTAKIRNQPHDFCNPIIIGVTANMHRSQKQKCLDAGMNDVIKKPASAETIINALQKKYS